MTSQNIQDQNACINQLRQMDGAKQQFALEYNLTGTNYVTAEQILPYLARPGVTQLPPCPAGGTYTLDRIDKPPTCSIPGHTLSPQGF